MHKLRRMIATRRKIGALSPESKEKFHENAKHMPDAYVVEFMRLFVIELGYRLAGEDASNEVHKRAIQDVVHLMAQSVRMGAYENRD